MIINPDFSNFYSSKSVFKICRKIVFYTDNVYFFFWETLYTCNVLDYKCDFSYCVLNGI